MQRDHATAAEVDTEAEDNSQETLKVIREQGRLTLELVRSILGLLLPKDREGPTLDQLLAAIMAQQRDIIQLGKKTRADVHHLGETLPSAVAEAVESGGFARAPRS